jgi:hypothetical protein
MRAERRRGGIYQCAQTYTFVKASKHCDQLGKVQTGEAGQTSHPAATTRLAMNASIMRVEIWERQSKAIQRETFWESVALLYRKRVSHGRVKLKLIGRLVVD